MRKILAVHVRFESLYNRPRRRRRWVDRDMQPWFTLYFLTYDIRLG